MKSVLFFAIVCVLGIILWAEAKKLLKVEGFQGDKPPVGSSPTLNVPVAGPPAPKPALGGPQPFAPPTTDLLGPPPGQEASVNSYVYEDPAEKKAPLQRLRTVYQDVRGFLENEGPGLSKLGDPSVTLPLGTARADRQRLEDELNVLQRNPGLQSSLTMKDVDQIQANLGYLQRKWRLSPNDVEVEGFQSSAAPASLDALLGGYALPDVPSSGMNSVLPTSSTPGGGATGIGANTQPATMVQLQDLSLKIAAEIQRKKASGSQDPVLLAQVSNFEAIKKLVDDVIKKVTNKTVAEKDIPIPVSVYTNFLPQITASTLDLPDWLQKFQALFPAAATGEMNGNKFVQSLVDQYGSDLLKNVSFDWDIKLKYTGESDKQIAGELTKALATATLPRPSGDLLYGPGDTAQTQGAAPGTEYRGSFDSIIGFLKKAAGMDAGSATGSSAGAATDATGIDTNAPAPDVTGHASGLDWKDRSAAICDQITKRGMNAYDFGCMKDTSAVSENFSYRGYAKMICSRLATNYDPSIPVLCGCPPPTWPGWRQ